MGMIDSVSMEIESGAKTITKNNGRNFGVRRQITGLWHWWNSCGWTRKKENASRYTRYEADLIACDMCLKYWPPVDGECAPLNA